MKQLLLIFALVLFITQVDSQSSKKYALVIHGGAGVMDKDKMSAAVQWEYTDVLNQALHVGDSVLRSGGTCLDAVERTIMILEDSP